MIIPKDLFLIDNQISSLKQGFYNWKFNVPKNLPYFDGHFPSGPILPAVAVIDATTECLKSITKNQNLKIEKIKSAKFLGTITPEMRINVSLQSIKKNEWLINWENESKKLCELLLLLK